MSKDRVNTTEAASAPQASTAARTTLSFYRYVHIAEPQQFRDSLYRELKQLDALGRIYVAAEGINAQMSLPSSQLDTFRDLLDATPGLQQLRLNIAIQDDPASFRKLFVRVRPKIVADGLDDSTFNPGDGGTHLDATGFNEMAQHPDAIIVDMRNHYESEVGYFEGALRPEVDTFRESLPVVEELLRGKEEAPVLMYCTGGIRCEKASAWFKHRGFTRVFQLDGGIINYARQVEREGLPNRFVGSNFVFDDRLGERIGEEVVSRCHQCGQPSDRHVNCVNTACHLLFLQCKACAKTFHDACSHTCAAHTQLPSDEQRATASAKTFNGQRYPSAHYRASHGELDIS